MGPMIRVAGGTVGYVPLLLQLLLQLLVLLLKYLFDQA